MAASSSASRQQNDSSSDPSSSGSATGPSTTISCVSSRCSSSSLRSFALIVRSYALNVVLAHEVTVLWMTKALRAAAPVVTVTCLTPAAALLLDRGHRQRAGDDDHRRGEDPALDPVPRVRDDGHACPAAERIHRPSDVNATMPPSIHSWDRTAMRLFG